MLTFVEVYYLIDIYCSFYCGTVGARTHGNENSAGVDFNFNTLFIGKYVKYVESGQCDTIVNTDMIIISHVFFMATPIDGGGTTCKSHRESYI